MTRHLGHMMLLQMLRQYLEAQASHPVGWLFALADPRLRAAIEAMHAQPAQRWTLPQLAAVAGQSRSAFALHFRNRVGVTPLDYLLRWRMRLATRRLKDSAATVTSIAQALGYDSDSAFSHAFKRGHGVLAAPVPAAPRGRAGGRLAGFDKTGSARLHGRQRRHRQQGKRPEEQADAEPQSPWRPRRLASSQVATANRNMKINSIAIATPCHAESPV
jgi:AraC-like DNA-binding protein